MHVKRGRQWTELGYVIDTHVDTFTRRQGNAQRFGSPTDAHSLYGVEGGPHRIRYPFGMWFIHPPVRTLYPIGEHEPFPISIGPLKRGLNIMHRCVEVQDGSLPRGVNLGGLGNRPN